MLLKKGSTGSSVKILQDSLQKLGFKIQVTSIYDEQTETNVRIFQEDNDLKPVDGIVGNITWKAIQDKLKTQISYFKESYVWLSPSQLRCTKVSQASKDIVKKYKNFVNANFWGTKGTIGWMVSENKILSRRDEYKQWKGNVKASLIIFNDGTVLIKQLLDSEIVEMLKKNNIKFMVQGFISSQYEGFNSNEVGRKCNRPIIGYCKETNKIFIGCFNGTEEDARTLAKKYNLSGYVCLDGGMSTNFYVNSVAQYSSSRQLNNIIHW